MSDTKNAQTLVTAPAGAARKAYRTPTLRSYGDIRVLTQKGATREGAIDSSGKANKTGA